MHSHRRRQERTTQNMMRCRRAGSQFHGKMKVQHLASLNPGKEIYCRVANHQMHTNYQATQSGKACVRGKPGSKCWRSDKLGGS